MKYIDLVLVEDIISKVKSLATVPAHTASAGDLVRLDNGTIGNLVGAAWIGDPEDEKVTLLSQFCPIGTVTEVFRRKELE